VLTPEERRGAFLILVLVLLGGAWDGWSALHPQALPAPEASKSAPVVASAFSAPAEPPPVPRGDSLPVRAAPPLVDVNHAGAPELDGLHGIGPVLARRIVEHREKNGPFRSIEELRAVRGIGPSLIARLSGRVRFGT